MDDVKDFIKGYFPRRWFAEDAAGYDRLITMMAIGMKTGQDIVERVYAEAFVGTAVATLGEREALLALPSGQNLDIELRRNRIRARKWQRGGPTNKKDFEAALSQLSGGAKSRLNPDFPNFSVLYEIDTTNLNLPLLEEYILRNKLAHLAHAYHAKGFASEVLYSSPVETIVYTAQTPVCGAYTCGGGIGL